MADGFPTPSGPPVRRYEPLAPAAGAFLAGILLGEYAGGGMVAWAAVALAAAGAWAVARRRRAGEGRLLVLLVVMLAAAGAAWYRAAVDPPPNDVGRLADARPLVVLEGTVVRAPRQSTPPDDVFLPSIPYYIRSTLTLQVRRARVGNRWRDVGGRVDVTVRQALPAAGGPVRAPDLGDRVQVTGLLLPLGGPANPGAFDMASYLRRQGVRALVRTDHWQAVRVVEAGADRARWWIGAMQRWALGQLGHIPSEDGRAVIAAVMFSRRDLLDATTGPVLGRDLSADFTASGAAHFLAVSGLHVGMVAGLVLVATRLVGLRPRPTALVVSIAVLAYGLMADFQPSVLRSVVIIWILCLGWAVGRQPVGLNSLAAAAIVVLVIQPGDLFTASFQLSFAIVMGLFWLTSKVERAVLRVHTGAEAIAGPPGPAAYLYRRFVRRTAALSVAASLVSMPLKAFRFQIVAWMAPVASVLLMPLVFLLLASGLVLVGVGWVHPAVGGVLALAPDALGRGIAAVVRTLPRVPGGFFHTADFSWPWMVVVYGLTAGWVWRERLGVSRRRLAIAALASAAVFLWTGGPRPPAHVRATFLAVGGGSTTLLELPSGLALLYDAGSSLSHARAGEAVTAPVLWSRGLTRVDAVFLSHAHFDHFKDLLPLVERFGVRRVYVPPTFLRRRLASDDRLVEALLARGVRVEFFGAGDRLAGTGGVEVRALWPRGPASQTKEINDGSLVLEVADGGRRLLLTGDLEAAGIDGLLAAEPLLRADAMLWPHHGHEPEAVGRLARRAGARVLVVSAKCPPAPPRAPDWAADLGAAYFHTGWSGAVTVELRPQGPHVETFGGGPAAPPALAQGDDETDAEDGEPWP